jgi:hypothetical protein
MGPLVTFFSLNETVRPRCAVRENHGQAEFRETPQVIAFELGGVHPVEVVGSEVVEFVLSSLRR